MSEPGHAGADGPEDFAQLFDGAPCGYLSVAADGRVTLANRRIAAWTGIEKADLVGQRLRDLLSVPARVFYETNVSPLLRMQGFVDEVAMDFRAGDGGKVQYLVNAAERRDAAGDLLYTRLAIFRATERRRYERALVDASEATERAAAAERESSHRREQFIAVLGPRPAQSARLDQQRSPAIALPGDRQRARQAGTDADAKAFSRPPRAPLRP